MNKIFTKNEIETSIKKLEKIIADFEFIIDHQIFYIDDYISKIKNQIDIHREKLIHQINAISNEMISKLDSYNQELVENLKKLNSSDYKDSLNKLKETLNEKIQLIQNEECTKIQNGDDLIRKIEQDIREYKMEMKKYKNKVKSNKKIIFEPVNYSSNYNELFGQLFVKQNEFIHSNDNGNLIKSFIHNSNDKLFSIELVQNEKYIIGCSNGKIKIFNLNSKECMQILEGHSDYITSIKLFDNAQLISSSGDGNIKIWDLKSNQCMKTLKGHIDKVNDICLSKCKNYLFSGSSDKTIKVWILNNNFECITTLFGHMRGVNCIKVNSKNKLISSSNDKTIKIWSLENFKFEKSLIGHKRGIESIEITKLDDILSYSNDNVIKIWNGLSYECVKSLNFCDNKNDSIRLRLLTDKYIIYLINYENPVNGVNCKINLYDLEHDKIIKTINGTKLCVADFHVMKNGKILCLIPETNFYKINIYDLNN